MILILIVSVILGMQNIRIVISEPTFYTSFVDVCDYAGARNSSKIATQEIFSDNEVYGGFFTVNKKFHINLYSVFIKSEKDWKKSPLIIWIQGQPGCTSLYAIFGQNGPYEIDTSFKLTKRTYAWTKEYNVLYLDNAILTGYSFSRDPTNLFTYLEDMGFYLYDALHQFYQIFPEVSRCDLYIAGEMYSGKYLLLLGHTIHKRNPISHVKMRLRGIYVGNGFTDPENMYDYSKLLYQIGLIDYDKMKDMQILEETIRKGILSEQYGTAQRQSDSLWDHMDNIGFKYVMDFTNPNTTFKYYIFDYLNSSQFRRAFGLESQTFHRPDLKTRVFVEAENKKIELRVLLERDVLKSVKNLLPVLLDNYRVLFYGAQFDLLVPYVHIANCLRRMSWSGAEEYYNHDKTPRYNWYVDHELAGYYKSVRNLTEVLVRNAAHMIDVSQPKWAFHLLKGFITNGFKAKQDRMNITFP